MRYSPHLLDEIRARLPVSQVAGRRVALKKAGREYRGLSPFKVEKSPSFFVNDQKGFYHCFASGEHGDIFTFLIKTEGLSFPEAIEKLASDAGMELPARDARDDEREKARRSLYDVMELAAAFFEHELQGLVLASVPKVMHASGAVGMSVPAGDAAMNSGAAGLSSGSAAAGAAQPQAVHWLDDLERESRALLQSGVPAVWDTLTRQFEARLIQTALAVTRGRRIEAAQKLGIGRNTITRKIQELSIGD